MRIKIKKGYPFLNNDEYLTEKDIMHVYLDDLNGYLNRDIMSYAKADPIHIATIVGG